MSFFVLCHSFEIVLLSNMIRGNKDARKRKEKKKKSNKSTST